MYLIETLATSEKHPHTKSRYSFLEIIFHFSSHKSIRVHNLCPRFMVVRIVTTKSEFRGFNFCAKSWLFAPYACEVLDPIHVWSSIQFFVFELRDQTCGAAIQVIPTEAEIQMQVTGPLRNNFHQRQYRNTHRATIGWSIFSLGRFRILGDPRFKMFQDSLHAPNQHCN